MERYLVVFNVDWILEKEIGVVRLWCKDEKNNTVVVLDNSLTPYFYIETANNVNVEKFVEEVKNRLKLSKLSFKSAKIVEKNILGETKKLIKIFVLNPRDVGKIRDIVKNWKEVREEYEYDISLERRYMIDRNIFPFSKIRVNGKLSETNNIKYIRANDVESIGIGEINLKVLVFDIETVGEQIIMISLLSNDGFKRVLIHNRIANTDYVENLVNEEMMLRKFIEILKKVDPDIIVTYNGDKFDFLKIRERCSLFRISCNIGRDGSSITFVRRGKSSSARIIGRIHIDLFEFVNNIMAQNLESEILTLDSVAKEVIGKGKKEMGWKEIENLWKKGKDIDRIVEYCMNDSEITLELFNTLNDNIFEIVKLVRQNIFDVSRMAYSQLVEWMIMRRAFERNEIILNRPKIEEIKTRRAYQPYTGGYVHQPKTGLHENVAVFDFKGLYPSIIVTFNVSPETLDKRSDNIVTVPGEEHFFDLNTPGFIPSIVRELIERRKDVKEEMKSVKRGSKEYRVLNSRQYALKIIANASYGYYAYAGARWYSRICAKSIAAFGRHYIRKVIEEAENRGLNVVYGDTDSLFISNIKREEAINFARFINNILPGFMELEFEDIYKRCIFVYTKEGRSAKKRYAMLDENGNIIIRGFEKVRRDWSEIAKKTQENIIKMVLNGDVDKAKEFVSNVILKLKTGNIDKKELVIYTQLTKPLEDYEQNAPHIIAAKKYITLGIKVGEGSVIGYIITKGGGSIAERAEPYEFAKNYDDNYYIDHQVLPAAMRILSIFNIREEDLKTKSQLSLKKFF